MLNQPGKSQGCTCRLLSFPTPEEPCADENQNFQRVRKNGENSLEAETAVGQILRKAQQPAEAETPSRLRSARPRLRPAAQGIPAHV